MKLIYDKSSLEGGYDERNLSICKCGKHHYPSKKMFIEFLKKFKDVKGTADIWSEQNLDSGRVKIHVEVEYRISKTKIHHANSEKGDKPLIQKTELIIEELKSLLENEKDG
jgi:hypothetical protein